MAGIVSELIVLSPSGSIGHRPWAVTIIGGRPDDWDREYLCNPPCVRSDADPHTHAFDPHVLGQSTHAFGPLTHAFGPLSLGG